MFDALTAAGEVLFLVSGLALFPTLVFLDRPAPAGRMRWYGTQWAAFALGVWALVAALRTIPMDFTPGAAIFWFNLAVVVGVTWLSMDAFRVAGERNAEALARVEGDALDMPPERAATMLAELVYPTAKHIDPGEITKIARAALKRRTDPGEIVNGEELVKDALAVLAPLHPSAHPQHRHAAVSLARHHGMDLQMVRVRTHLNDAA